MMRVISLFVDLEIIDAVGIDGQDDALADEADAAAFQDFYFLVQFSRLQFAFEPALDLENPGLDGSLVDRQQDVRAVNAHFPLRSPAMTSAMSSGVRLP